MIVPSSLFSTMLKMDLRQDIHVGNRKLIINQSCVFLDNYNYGTAVFLGIVDVLHYMVFASKKLQTFSYYKSFMLYVR